jgi:quinol monooxygenase YgiN
VFPVPALTADRALGAAIGDSRAGGLLLHGAGGVTGQLTAALAVTLGAEMAVTGRAAERLAERLSNGEIAVSVGRPTDSPGPRRRSTWPPAPPARVRSHCECEFDANRERACDVAAFTLGSKLGAALCARLLEMSDSALVLVAEVHGRAGLAAELRALLTALADDARREAGCASFQVLSADDPGEFVMLASWSSEGALRSHYDTPHYRRYREHVGPLLARPSDVLIHHVATTVHARDPNPPDPGRLG